jgi:hypothetical protein
MSIENKSEHVLMMSKELAVELLSKYQEFLQHCEHNNISTPESVGAATVGFGMAMSGVLTAHLMAVRKECHDDLLDSTWKSIKESIKEYQKL